MTLRGTQLEQGEQLRNQGEELRDLRTEVRAGLETIVGMLRRLEPGAGDD